MWWTSRVLVSLVALFVAERESSAGTAATKAPSSIDAQLDELEKQLSAAREKLLDLLKQKDMKAKEVPGFLREVFDFDKMKGETQRIRDAIAKVVVTPEDAEGLSFYSHGDHANARKKFNDSEVKSPNREFPVYFLGAMALEEEEYARAAEFFSKVVARNRECRSAFVLRRLAKLCEGKRGIPDVELLLLFDQASREALRELGLEKEAEEPTFALSLVPPLASDPVLFKMLELLDDILAGNLANLIRRYGEADTVERKLSIVLQMGSDKLAKVFVPGLAQEYPDNKDIRVFAFLHRYFACPEEEQRKSLDAFAAELAAIQQLDKENGVLVLLGVSPEGDDFDLTKGKRLTAEELGLFRKGARAKEFRTFATFGLDEVRRDWLALYGGLALCVPETRRPWSPGHIRRVARRASANVLALFEQGKAAEALELCSNIEAVARRLEAETKSVIAVLVADGILESLYRGVQKYAVKAGDQPLLKRCLERRATTYRHEAEFHVACRGFDYGVHKIPVRRLVEALERLGDSAAFAQELSARRLKADPTRYYREATKALANVGEGYVMSGVYQHVVVLGDLKSRDAIPLLTKLAKHSDPLLAYLAAKAIVGN